MKELPWVVDNTQGAVDGVAERRKVMAVDYRTRTGIARRRGTRLATRQEDKTGTRTPAGLPDYPFRRGVYGLARWSGEWSVRARLGSESSPGAGVRDSEAELGGED